jgi:hypothetical protein
MKIALFGRYPDISGKYVYIGYALMIEISKTGKE